MAITDETKNKVITIEGLDHFYSRLTGTFLKIDDATRYYAALNGNSSEAFSASSLLATNVHIKNSGSDGIEIRYRSTQNNEPAIVLQNLSNVSGGRVYIPVTPGTSTVATVEKVEDMLENKADLITLNSANSSSKLCKQVHPNVFDGADLDTGHGYNPKVGDIIYLSPNYIGNDIANYTGGGGLMLVTSLSPEDTYNYLFLCTPSTRTLYYNAYTKKLCRYNGRDGFTAILEGGGNFDPSIEYETATAEEIDDIINSYINGNSI